MIQWDIHQGARALMGIAVLYGFDAVVRRSVAEDSIWRMVFFGVGLLLTAVVVYSIGHWLICVLRKQRIEGR